MVHKYRRPFDRRDAVRTIRKDYSEKNRIEALRNIVRQNESRRIRGGITENGICSGQGIESLIGRVLMANPYLAVQYEPLRLTVRNGHGPFFSYIPTFVFPFHYIDGRMAVLEIGKEDRITHSALKQVKLASDNYGLYIMFAKSDRAGIGTSMKDESIRAYVDMLVDFREDMDGVRELFSRSIIPALNGASISRDNGLERAMAMMRREAEMPSSDIMLRP